MNVITFREAWQYGGPLMWVLVALSVIALAVCMYVWFSQRRNSLMPHALVSDVLEAFRKGDVLEARRLAERTPSAFSDLVLARDVQAEGGRIAARLNSSVEWLADIAAIAPLVGLLGTVLGMFGAFGGIASDVAANAKPVVLAQGVSQAIVTTIFGLVVAIPALLAFAVLRRRAGRRIAELEVLADEIRH